MCYEQCKLLQQQVDSKSWRAEHVCVTLFRIENEHYTPK
jgi:hypothetical protein